MRSISRGLDCPLADFTTGAAQLFLYCRQHTADSVLWFRFATHVGHFERSGANGRNRRSCILARAVYHSPVYCTASAYCRPCARSCILWCQPLIYYYCVLYIIHRYVLYILSTNSEKQTEQNIPVPTSWSWLKTLDIQEMKFSKTSQTVYSNDHWLMTSRRVLGGPMLMTPLCCLRDASPPNARFWLLRPVTLILVCVCFSNLTTFKLVCTHSEFTPVVAL